MEQLSRDFNDIVVLSFILSGTPFSNKRETPGVESPFARASISSATFQTLMWI